MHNQQIQDSIKGIAIIGMVGRCPGAKDVDEFWQHLCDGKESISFFSDEELEIAGIDPVWLRDPQYVKAGAILSDIEMFDAPFFDFSPREAEIMDPQHRILLESAWKALENAGYDPGAGKGLTGVYVGTNLSSYFLSKLSSHPDLIKSMGLSTLLSNSQDYAATRVSYKLNLKGPSINISTACSTSLVAVHSACQGLLNYECDMALAGGISIQSLQKQGYFYQEGGITSPDGHCRAFDASAQGTIFGDGVGIVVLKRLEDALADGDCINAVIKGSAINNDGAAKVGYTAPSVGGQASAIAEALAIAGFHPETITYIETHGTGTALGDPIEISALKKIFETRTKKKGFCAIGSVKTNVGHLNTAAGITGLIKTVMALKHKMIPPSLHFEQPNPEIDFANSPFYVNTKLSEWKAKGTPRRAGISSFGIGGTNAHVILEEAPADQTRDLASLRSRPWQLLVLSAKTTTALETATRNLAAHFQQHCDIVLPNVAYTLQVGRQAFEHRRMVVCHDSDDAVKVLTSQDPRRVLTYQCKPGQCPVIFMFSGQGAQYVNMGRELYEVEPTFRKYVDICAAILQPHLGLDIRHILYPHAQHIDVETRDLASLQQTAITQPALFIIEYALAQLWMEWGVRPEAMIGHSIGEYVAATIAGVFSLEDALAVVATRGQLMQQLPTGSMLAVPLPEKDVQSLLDVETKHDRSLQNPGTSVQIAAINSPFSCVVSGSTDAIAALQNQLSSQGIECRLLHTSHAFHSVMMQPILEPFVQAVKKVKLNPPQIRFISNVTGSWITDEQATNPHYWSQHLRQTVKFSSGITQLLQQFEGVFLELGPGRTLSTLTTQHLKPDAKQQVLTSLRHAKEQQSDVSFLLQTLGRLWLFGVEIDWSGFYTHEQRHRLPLPTYPFERQCYWIESKKQGIDDRATSVLLAKKPDIADWFYIPFWKPSLPPAQPEHKELAAQKSCTLVFADECGLGTKLVEQLQQQNQDIITVTVGAEFTKLNECQYTLNPQHDRDYDTLIKELLTQQKLPKTIVHLWSVTPVTDKELELEDVEKTQAMGFYSLLFLAQALGRQETVDEVQITVISNNLQPVTGTEVISPEKATLLGPIKVISQEYSNISCRSIDVILPSKGTWQEEKLVEQLLTELSVSTSECAIAYRGTNRWVQTFEPVRFDEAKIGKSRLKEGGVYLITGGLGGIGLIVAEYLARTVQAKLLLIGRKALPNRDEWEKWLMTHDETDSISCKILKVQELEQSGAEVLVVSADVTNREQMQHAIAQAESQFGQLNGVIHTAGVPGGGVIQRKTKEEADSILAPKVKGTLVLDAIVKNNQLDFLVLTSSTTSILGGFGQVDYCGANAFLDAFAHCNISKYGNSIASINWSAWQEVGMAVDTAVPQQLQELRAENLKQGILPNEGVDAFLRTLGSKIPQVVVSPSDFLNSLEQYNSYSEIRVLEFLETVNKLNLKHPRPDLSNDYVAPRTEIEQKFVEIWQQILGIERIGIYDNFFELGGDSLIGIQVISQLNKAFDLNMSIAKLYECPNVGSMAKMLISEESEKKSFEQRLSRGKRRRQIKIQKNYD
ncbi:polyketide synthase [Scytonema hofmannii PCC 7110]|uniref:Phenolphthiocerol/phthiocerol polyketide synthase subunit E n=2 Tax=Scytonema hofmannii TaxID=34078 RepID=A0A139WVX9_9CYAN|nr:type I polyketide synthase [Scytonema hofmannii]KYC36590.1 polyketide synthase [Scytonema hofmannii PCC 7110]